MVRSKKFTVNKPQSKAEAKAASKAAASAAKASKTSKTSIANGVVATPTDEDVGVTGTSTPFQSKAGASRNSNGTLGATQAKTGKHVIQTNAASNAISPGLNRVSSNHLMNGDHDSISSLQAKVKSSPRLKRKEKTSSLKSTTTTTTATTTPIGDGLITKASPGKTSLASSDRKQSLGSSIWGQGKLKISFDETSTSTYEYPSQQFLLDSMPPEPGDFDFPNPLKPGMDLESPTDEDADVQLGQLNTSLKSTPAMASTGGRDAADAAGLASYKSKSVMDYQLGMDAHTDSAAPPPVVRRPDSSRDNKEDEMQIKPAEENDTSSWSNSNTSDMLF